MSLTDATNSPVKRGPSKPAAFEIPESVTLFFDGETMASKADKYMGEMMAENHTLQFVGPHAMPLPVLDKGMLGGAIGNLIASFPDLTFNLHKATPKKNTDGSWSADIVVMGTHTGAAFTPKPGVFPAIDTTGTCVKVGPETFTLWTDAAGLVCKTEITPLGAGHPHGPPGFYLGIGGSLASPEGSLQERNIKRVQFLVSEFMAGRPEGYLAGVSDDMKGSVLGGLLPGGEGFEGKEAFAALMGGMEQYMEVKKFEPCNWRAVGSDVLFNVNWEFVWKPTGKTVVTTALVRKVVREGLICEKYHLVHAADVLGETSVAEELHTMVKSLVSEGMKCAHAKDTAGLEAFWDKYFTADTVFIRPSGNPLDKAGYLGMMASEDVAVLSDELLSVSDVKEMAGGQVAVFTYTTHSKFVYKGNENDDVAKFSVTAEKGPNGWKIVHVHRGTGQKPQ